MGEVYDKKYGIDSSSLEIKAFHFSRRMFAIRAGELFLAPENVTYTHAKWFELEGWMSSEDDSLMESITRGYFDSTSVCFYKGYDFTVDELSEKEIFSNLAELISKTSIDVNLHLFGGKIKQERGGNWPSRKDYGPIKEILLK